MISWIGKSGKGSIDSFLYIPKKIFYVKTQEQDENPKPPNSHLNNTPIHDVGSCGILFWLAGEYFFNDILYIGGGENVEMPSSAKMYSLLWNSVQVFKASIIRTESLIFYQKYHWSTTEAPPQLDIGFNFYSLIEVL